MGGKNSKGIVKRGMKPWNVNKMIRKGEGKYINMQEL
jgi:hypothetical protein